MSQTQMRPLISIGLNTYPDGVVHILPYTFGVRAPYPPNSPADSFAGHYNLGYSEGAYDAAWRVGSAGFIVGGLAGILGLFLFQRAKRRR